MISKPSSGLGAARQGRALDVNAVATRGAWKGKTALDVALEYGKAETAAVLRDELGALRAADLPQKKRPKSAMKNKGKRAPAKTQAAAEQHAPAPASASATSPRTSPGRGAMAGRSICTTSAAKSRSS